MDNSSRQPERVILFTSAALLDLAGIDNATAAIWGPVEAERYLDFLNDVFSKLPRDPKQGVLVDQHDEYRSYVAKFRRRRNAHGHRIIYHETDYGLLVIRVLHTAMNWPDHL